VSGSEQTQGGRKHLIESERSERLYLATRDHRDIKIVLQKQAIFILDPKQANWFACVWIRSDRAYMCPCHDGQICESPSRKERSFMNEAK